MRWLIDGMNVIGSRPDGWWRDRHAAMVKLVRLLERWAAQTGEEVTVVFESPPSPPIPSSVIEVAHAPRPKANSADEEILRLLRADPKPGSVRVVTSDQRLCELAGSLGAEIDASSPFRRKLDDSLGMSQAGRQT
jgi:predicted RNA-binding protein with PIN domain